MLYVVMQSSEMGASLKLMFIVLIVALPTLDCLMERNILKFLEDWRLRMCHPLSSLGLPTMDPFQVKNISFNMRDEELYNMSASILNFTVLGFSDFEIENLAIAAFPLMKSHLRAYIPNLNVSISYIANGSMFNMINVDSESAADIKVHQLTVELTWIFKVSPKLSIYLLNSTFDINGLKIGIDNLFKEPKLNDFVEYVLNEMGLEFLKGLQSKSSSINNLVETTLNIFMSTLSVYDVFQIISGYAGNNTNGMIFADTPQDCKQGI